MRHVHLLVLAALVGAVGLVVQVGAASAGSTQVTNANDAGAGSFRAAVQLANTDASVGHIVFVGNLDPIELQSTVAYMGDQSLSVVGNNAVLDASALVGAADAFRVDNGADLSVIELTIRNAPGEGLAYQVADGATGTKHVSLNGVRVIGAPDPEDGRGGHGVLINDQEDPEGSGTGGTPASLDVSVINSEFDGNGFAALDRDGLRVNEGGVGSLNFVVRNTLATDNGADGIELDERDVGDASFTVSGTQIIGNGSFHEVFPPADSEDIDLDDGMDVDESQAGALIGRVFNSAASDNFEEGFDFNENHAGDMRVEMTSVEASGNREEGLDLEEDDDFVGGGDLTASLTGVTTDGNCADGGDGGLKIRERGDGNVYVLARGVQANENLSDGINIREQNAGSLEVAIARPTANDNDADGIEFRQQDDGTLTAAASNGSASGNGGVGVRALSGSGGGTLHLDRVTIVPSGSVFASPTVTVTQT